MSPDRRQQGFSLLETLVVAGMLAMVLGACLGVMFQSQVRSVDRAEEEATRQAARIATARMPTELRLAGYRAGVLGPIQIAEPSRVQIVADIDDGSPSEPCAGESRIRPRAELVTFELDERGILRRGVQCRSADDMRWEGATSWTVLASDVFSDGTLFRYFDAEGNELGGGAPLGAAARDAVRSMTVALVFARGEERILGEQRFDGMQAPTRIKLRNRGLPSS